jgi:hypothetical protein
MSRTSITLALIPAICGILLAAATRADAHATRNVVLGTGVYCAGLMLVWIRRVTTPPPQAASPYQGEPVEPLAQLATIERSAAIARSSAVEFEHRIQPRLRRTAAERLRLRHGIDMAHDPEPARRLLGEETWQLLTTRHTTHERAAHAPKPQVILNAIEHLEEV